MAFRCWRVAAGFVLPALGFTPAARAQGCILCYTSLAASGPGGMHAFQMGMFVLLIPALLLFLGVFLLIFLRARTASAQLPSRAKARTYSPRLAVGLAKPAHGRA